MEREIHGSVHQASLGLSRFLGVTQDHSHAFACSTDYIIHQFLGESTSPFQTLDRVLPYGIVDEPSLQRVSLAAKLGC